MLRHPLLWAGASTLTALLLSSAGADAFFPFLLTLLAGWLCAFWFVGRTLDPRWGSWGPASHVGAAVALVPVLWVTVEVLPEVIPRGPAAAAFGLLAMGVAPAAGWVWITLLSRITGWMRRRDSRAAPAPPEWTSDGEGAVVRFAAVPLRLRTLSLVIAGVTTAAGLVAVVAIIAANDLAERVGPRLLIIAFGIILGLPVYVALLSVLRRQTVECAVRFVRDRLRLEVGATTHEWRLRDIDLLGWRTDSDYARVVVRSGGEDVSVIVGIARQRSGVAAGLPELSGRMTAVLAGAGLTERTRKGTTTTLRRPGR